MNNAEQKAQRIAVLERRLKRGTFADTKAGWKAWRETVLELRALNKEAV